MTAKKKGELVVSLLCSSGHMAAVPVIRIPLMENLSGTPVTPSQRHSFAVHAHCEIGFSATTVLFNSQSGVASRHSSQTTAKEKGDISEPQMTFTFTRKYSDIFKTARLKMKELLKRSDIPRQRDYLLMGVLVSVESSTAAPCCHIPETGSFEQSGLGEFQTFRLFMNLSTCSMWEWRCSATDGGQKARPSALTLNRMRK